jgi:hypothetical protein
MTIGSREIIERIRLKMPLVITLPDPITGEPFHINRDNILALLIIDMSNLAFEAQIVSTLYAEMARIRSAAFKAHQEAEVRLRQWKAQRRIEYRKQSDKKPSERECEDYYQTHKEYVDRYQETIDLAVIVSLADDLKKAFDMKARALHDLSGEIYGHNQMQNASERLAEIELEQLAAEAVDQSDSAAAAADFREQRSQATHPDFASEDNESEDASEENEEDNDESEIEQASPPPRAAKKKRGGKNPRPLKRGKGK